ncbi:hypothetical protein PPUTLS46_001777 [Pseudomonas putida LS46]|nr:hypothetical protein [Pseudomonas putida]EMR49354.1 hypothetical protein PPUTLS46_001777 [Pseudomonas putida LS46]
MNNDAYLQVDQKPIYHLCYRTILRAMDERYDIRGYVLAEMVRTCLKYRAILPAIQRSYFALHAQSEAITYLEHLTANLLFGPQGRFSPGEYHYSQVASLKP